MWPSVVVSNVAPVSSAAASSVAPVACVTSGVTPTFGVAASNKDSAPVAISEVAVVAAPVPGKNIDNLTRRISLSHDD